MKKIRNFLLFLFVTFGLASCVVNTQNYSIEYYVNNKQVELQPDSYYSNQYTILPTPIIKEYESFDGWYDNPELTGEKITYLEKQNENLKLYGQIKSNSTTEDNLEKAFSYKSFSFELKCESINDNYSSLETFYVDNNSFHQQSDFFDLFFTTKDGLDYVYFEDEDEYYYLTEEDEDFEYFEDYLFKLDLSSIDTNIFRNTTEGYYIVDDTKLDDTGYLFTGYLETVKSFKMYLNKGLLLKIVIETIDEDDYEYLYTLTFSSFDSTTVEIPDGIHYEDITTNQNVLINSVYDLDKGSLVTVEGKVTGIYGNNFYLSDNDKGILVYMGNTTDFNSLIEVGSCVIVSGSVDIYKTVHQISNVTSISTSSKTFNVKDVYLTDVLQSTLKNYVNDLVNVDKLTIKTIPASSSSNTDITFEGSINGEKVNIFISKHLSKTVKDALINKVNTLGVDSIVNLSNVHISYYNQYQIVLTSASNIALDSGTIISRGLELSKYNLTVDYNTSLSDILSSIKVYEKFSDSTKGDLSSTQYTVNTDDYEIGKSGTFSFVYTYNGYKATCTVVVKSKPMETSKVEVEKSPMIDVIKNMGYDEATKTTYGVNIGLPSIGNPKVLVIPIEFSNCKAPTDMVSNLEKAFFGTSSDTGWESLKSYYYKSSYGKLEISGTVLAPYNTGKTTSYYDNLYSQYLKDLEKYELGKTDEYPDCVEYSIIKEVLEYYDNQINYNDYDYNNDGCIDSIYLVYTYEYSEDSDSFWWAYTNEYLTDDYEYYDDVEADFYMFMSYEFFFDKLNNETVTLNAETVIHETGHLLGLDDYYDYDSTVGPDGGIGGGDMMDYNVGDHNAYSKLLLGWINPYVVSGTTSTITLNSFGSTGDAVIVFKQYEGSFFGEYYIIDFYTPDGLNEQCAGDRGLFATSGIRIYHIDSTLNSPEDCWSIFELTKCNNSYTEHLLIKLVEADGRNDIESGGYSEDSDLFSVGDTFSNVKWYDKSDAGFSVKVNYIENGQANITIEYK